MVSHLIMYFRIVNENTSTGTVVTAVTAVIWPRKVPLGVTLVEIATARICDALLEKMNAYKNSLCDITMHNIVVDARPGAVSGNFTRMKAPINYTRR
jgi:hypothetical protein